MAPKHPKAPAGCFWKGNTLYGRTRVKGRLFRWSLETDDPKVAAARRKEGKGRLIAVKRGDAVRLLSEVIEDWSTEWLVPNKGPKTATRYLCSLGQLAPYLDGKALTEIDGKLVADIIRARRVSGVTNATIKRDLVALSSVCNYAIVQGWRDDNPVLARMRLIEEKRPPIVLPDPADVALIMKRAKGMIPDMMRLAIATGAREEELFGAEDRQIDHRQRQMTLIGKGRKGVKRMRVIDLDPFGGYDLVRALPERPAGARMLLWQGRSANLNAFSTAFCKAVNRTAAWAKKEGIPFRKFTFHHLRHLHAVQWLKDGRSIYDLQRRLGHASIKTTEDYCAFLTPEEDRVVKGLAVSPIVSPRSAASVA